jgi:hypothetical protein
MFTMVLPLYLTLKGALSLGATYLLQLLPVLCGFHIVCLSVDGNVLSSAIDTIANIAYLALSLVVGSIAFLWGLVRKLWLNQWSAYGTAPENLAA